VIDSLYKHSCNHTSFFNHAQCLNGHGMHDALHGLSTTHFVNLK